MAQQLAEVLHQWMALLMLCLVMQLNVSPSRAQPDLLQPVLPRRSCASSQQERCSDLALDIRGAPEGTPMRDYVAAVYEFDAVTWSDTQPYSWTQNLAIARQQAKTASAQGADILVLAEYGIGGGIIDFRGARESVLKFAPQLPSLDKLVVACDEAQPPSVLSTLSCIAREEKIYIVANLIEKEACNDSSTSQDRPCSPLGFFLYNTNVVLDKKGTFIQKYRKLHLFGQENTILQTPEPRLAAFRTDFGVTFGLMTCFDILFEVPAVELTKRGVSHLVFPTFWGDELPSLTALQMHSAWARGLNVTLLASGYHDPAENSIGSGVYSGGGVLNYTYDYSTTKGKLVTAQVSATGQMLAPESPKNAQTLLQIDEEVVELQTLDHSREDESECSSFHYDVSENSDEAAYYPTLHYNISEYISALFTGENQRVCHGDFCCQVNIAASDINKIPISNSAPVYRVLAYKGHRNFAPHWATEVCSVVLCADSTQGSCSLFPSQSAIQLPEFELSATFSSDSIVFPSVILQQVQATGKWEYAPSQRSLTVKSMSTMLTAQLYGRNYALDLP